MTPTIDEAIKAADVIKSYCEGKLCGNCVFCKKIWYGGRTWYGTECRFTNVYHPSVWYLKDLKEVTVNDP